MEPTSELDFKRLLLLIYRKKALFLLAACMVTTAVVLLGYLLPKTYEAKSVIFIERNVLNELVKDVTVTSSIDEKVKALSIVMRSRSLILKVMSDLKMDLAAKSAEQVEGAIRNFQEKTTIEVELNKAAHRNTDLFTVSYTDSDPRRASNFVNALVKRYIEDNVLLKREEAYGANKFLLDQISSFKQKLNTVDRAIAGRLKVRTGPEKNAAQYEQLQALLLKRDALLSQYTENHPEVMKLKAEIETIRAQMRDVPAEAGSDQALADLEQERETTKKIYEDLLSALRKSEVSTQLEVQDKAGAFRIIDPAVVPASPLSPNMLHVILLALAGGIAAGSGVMVVIDKFDRSVKSVDVLKKMGMPVLAVISTMQTPQQAAAARKKDGVIYLAAGLYLAALLTVAVLEVTGSPVIGNFVNGTKTELGKTVKKIRS